MRNIELPGPALLPFISRLFNWTGLVLAHWITGNINRLKGLDDTRLRGPRLRRLFEKSGASAVKIGLQVALRIDIFPLDICNELSSMADRAPAMPLEYAIRRIEAAGATTVDRLFRILDPEPIVSDTTSCVYQAEMMNGDRVAVKVRRPGILEELSADLRALGFLLSLLEFLTLVRPGTYNHLERELRLKLAEELDFLMAARYQRLFRRRARRDGLKFLSAARVYAECNSSDVMVSEFIQGIWCHELMDPEFNTSKTYSEAVKLDISVTRVARNLLQAIWWAQLESPFFPVEPRARNIVIQSGSKIVFVNLGECGRVSGGKRELYHEVMRRLMQRDVSSASDVFLQLLMPLPYIDIDDFKARLERGMWQHFFALQHREALPWERTSSRMWLELLESAHQFGVPIHLEIIRLMRSVLLTEHIASRLWPRINLLREFMRYDLRADRRKVSEAIRDLEYASTEQAGSAGVARLSEFGERFRRLRFLMDNNMRRLPLQFMSLTAKGAYVFSSVLRIFTTGLVIFLSILLLVLLDALLAGNQLSLPGLVSGIVFHPAFIVFMAILLVLTLRRILFRLGDSDSND